MKVRCEKEKRNLGGVLTSRRRSAEPLAPHGHHEGHGRPRSEDGLGVEIGRCRGSLDMSLFRALPR